MIWSKKITDKMLVLMESRMKHYIFILFVLLVGFPIKKTSAGAITNSSAWSPAEPVLTNGAGDWLMLLVEKIDCLRPNLTIEICVLPRIMSECVLRSCYDEAKDHSRLEGGFREANVHISDTGRRVQERKKHKHMRELKDRYMQEKRDNKLHAAEYKGGADLFPVVSLITGVSVLGLVIVSAILTGRDNEQLPIPSQQNISFSIPCGCVTTCKYYLYGASAISSALGLVVYLIHVCINKS